MIVVFPLEYTHCPTTTVPPLLSVIRFYHKFLLILNMLALLKLLILASTSDKHELRLASRPSGQPASRAVGHWPASASQPVTASRPASQPCRTPSRISARLPSQNATISLKHLLQIHSFFVRSSMAPFWPLPDSSHTSQAISQSTNQ